MTDIDKFYAIQELVAPITTAIEGPEDGDPIDDEHASEIAWNIAYVILGQDEKVSSWYGASAE